MATQLSSDYSICDGFDTAENIECFYFYTGCSRNRFREHHKDSEMDSEELKLKIFEAISLPPDQECF